MPEMRFEVMWPDGAKECCYSPSLIIKEYFQPQMDYELSEFLYRSTQALQIASERVRQKFGVPCGRAAAQLASIKANCTKFKNITNAHVRVLSFHE